MFSEDKVVTFKILSNNNKNNDKDILAVYYYRYQYLSYGICETQTFNTTSKIEFYQSLI